MKYYLDSCIDIYMIKRVADFRHLILSLIPEDSQLMVSDLTKLECRVKPIEFKGACVL
jgi:hypothetical protein